ncbi:MAG: von Willebrand factor type A domain-containing protein [Chloroflexota bacterium]
MFTRLNLNSINTKNIFRKSSMTAISVLCAGSLLVSACGAPSYSQRGYSSGDAGYAEEAAPAPLQANRVRAVPAEGNGYSTGGSAIVNDKPYDATFFQNYGVNPFIDTEDDHLSTFAMDVDTASYTVARRYVHDGHMPDPDSVRTEEFLNYFKRDYTPPSEGAFAIHLEGAPSPFGGERYHLMRVGLQGKVINAEDRKDASLVFVVDVSGSMNQENRIGLVKRSLRLLVEELRPTDEVGIVVYGGGAGLHLRPTPASQKDRILRAIDRLQANGSTNLEQGLVQGYQMAEEMMRMAENAEQDRIVRLILASDGVANVGNTGSNSILNRVQDYVDQGITLSTVGFGMGNYNDVLMEQLANDGDGNYAYVDTLDEANRFFVENLTGMLQVIAKDAKVQVDFNPAVVSRYRLLGYENRRVADDDFRDDTVDAGEVGAGHSVTALYEVKFAKAADGEEIATNEVAATVYVRYQDMDSGQVVEVNNVLGREQFANDIYAASPSFQLDTAIAEYAEILRESYWAQDSHMSDVRMIAEQAADFFVGDEDVDEFLGLVRQAEQLLN